MTNVKKRIETLDWLRGLMALSIMFYHLIGWHISPIDSSNPLGRLGIYAVSIFFVLSGLSMAIVYNKYIKDVVTSINFLIRRVFRIWPLFWVVCFLVVLPKIIKGDSFSWKVFVLNITTMFGFINPGECIITGGWSIGNEMVYYTLTPLIILLYNKSKVYGNLAFMASVIIGVLFSFFLLTPNKTLAEQWLLYINPFNNLFLYFAGISIYYNIKDINLSKKEVLLVLLSSIVLFCIVPFKGDQINIVTGFGRIIFASLSISLVIGFYKLKVSLLPLIAKKLETFGLATYAIYLLHPVVNMYLMLALRKININISSTIQIILASSVTIVVSVLSYYLFELKVIGIGKRITKIPSVLVKIV